MEPAMKRHSALDFGGARLAARMAPITLATPRTTKDPGRDNGLTLRDVLAMLFDAAILFGLGFLSTMAGTGLNGNVEVVASVYAGAIGGGIRALTFLSHARGLNDGKS